MRDQYGVTIRHSTAAKRDELRARAISAVSFNPAAINATMGYRVASQNREVYVLDTHNTLTDEFTRDLALREATARYMTRDITPIVEYPTKLGGMLQVWKVGE